ncbi:MAG TPA: O-acetyl-ADP-ribose deacetylase [Prolixibacteraceae bacterium]|nr:O-acetyl-ADP-ribose deacetylase [Prolixibacteraceae bacterium]
MDKIEVVREDITRLNVNAIVNAANCSLLGGGGVDGAIHRAAGPELLNACELLNGCNTGDAKITSGFKLPAQYVIHTVGPVWNGGKNREKELLASCYRQSLQIALNYGIRSIAFPNISTGVYGFPKQEAASIAFETVLFFMTDHPEIEKVLFCCFDEENFAIYNNLTCNKTIIKSVQSTADIQVAADLASTIWNEYYVPIIGQKQVNYMINAFQSAEAIEKQIKSDNLEYYLMYHLAEPAGYISIKLLGTDLFLSKFYIIKEKRGTGLGKTGLNFIKNRAKELGANAITLTVNKNNTNSIKAYDKMGFKNTGSVVADIGAGFVMDDYTMRLDING